MMLSNLDNGPPETDLSDNKPTQYQYDLRLEIGAEQFKGTVPVVTVFQDLVQRMKNAVDDGTPLVILTATDKMYFEQKEMSSDEFQKAFHVEQADGRVSKVLLGFKLRTTIRLSELKKRLMHTHLIPNDLFLREHSGGFHNGVKTYNFGFLRDEHPDHPDVEALNSRFAKLLAEAWRKLEKDDRKKWRPDLPTKSYGNSGIMIPITYAKERLSATHENKEKIITSALVVSTPSKYGKLLKILLDMAIMDKKITSLIPFALNRENPEGFYGIVAHQARFIENHRNIPISNVTKDHSHQTGTSGKNLVQLLKAHPDIQRVAVDMEKSQIHVSTSFEKYRLVHQWLTQALPENAFPYGPTLRAIKQGTYGNNSTKYSAVFQDLMEATSNTDEISTVKTNRSNPWKNRPPLAISYVTSEEAFPSLPKTKKPAQATASTTSETLDEDTIQSAISIAIKKLEEQYRLEMTQMRMEMQTRIEAVEHHIQDLGPKVATQTYKALVNDESPLATKLHLQNEINKISTQLATIISMVSTGTKTNTSSSHDSNSPPRNSKRTKPTLTPVKKNLCEQMYTQEESDDDTPSSDQDTSFPSATSDPIMDLEGCEE